MFGRYDALGREGAPLELLMLGALRYLRRGWTFDDLAECTGTKVETVTIHSVSVLLSSSSSLSQ
jgi:hypothetical protein